MRHRRADVVRNAIDVLDEHGLEGLSMRRLADRLEVRPSALYHHFPGKEALLAAVADEILQRGRQPAEIVTWEAELRLVCVELRDAMVAHRDAADLIATVHALGTGARQPTRRIHDALRRAGADDDLARVGARTLVHFVFGHVADEQLADDDNGVADFAVGLDLVLDGLSVRLGA